MEEYDKTHVHFYGDEIPKMLGFMVMDWKVNSVRYPLIDLYEKHKTLRALRKLKIPVVGYQTIEVLCEVKK